MATKHNDLDYEGLFDDMNYTQDIYYSTLDNDQDIFTQQQQNQIQHALNQKALLEENNKKNKVNANKYKEKPKALPPIIIKYPECKKGGYHNGQSLNMTCMQAKCANNSVICSICYEEQHQGHQIKPLKMVIEKARMYLSRNNQAINTNKAQQLIKESQKTILQKYSTVTSHVSESINQIKATIQNSHNKLSEEFLQKVNNQHIMDIISKLQQKQQNIQDYKNIIKQLINVIQPPSNIPLKIQNVKSTDVNTIKKSLEEVCEKIDKQFDTKSGIIKQTFTNYLEYIKKVSQCAIFLPTEFTFSQQLHHSGISVLSQTVVKSVQSYDYHFALMQPSLEIRGNQLQMFQFKIIQNTNSWIAVGVCHKQTVVKNNYTFNYSTLGHGAYLISSNGGSWSTLNSSHNNVVTSFNFKKNDIIVVKYNPKVKKIYFNRKGSEDRHELDFQLLNDNELHLCVLFYYGSDEVKYLGQQNPGLY